MNEHFGMGIRGKVENLPLVSNFIGNSMLKFGLSEYEQLQIQMAVDEAINNIIKHGDPEDKIQIKCKKEGKKIKIIIENKGEQFNPSNKNSPNDNPGEMKVYFIKKNMNKVEYGFKDGKNVLTLIKYV